MAIAFQGFAIEENLSEAKNDRAILNNLGGAPLGDDISLLFNNTRNTSSIVVTELNIQGSTIKIPDSLAVFSNKNKVTVGTSTYYVRNSNGVDEFSLSTLSTLDDLVFEPPAGTYIRSDEITFENITNFSIVRRNPDVNRVDADTELGFLNTSSSNALLSSEDAKTILESTEANVDFYKYRLGASLKSDQNFLGNRVLTSTGSVIIKDPNNINSGGLSNSGPGLFIYNPDTGSGIRAFSSNSNPWTEVGVNLEADTTKVTIKNLNVDFDQITLLSKGSAVLAEDVTSSPINSTNFTHKLPVKINGEIYYLCLKLEP